MVTERRQLWDAWVAATQAFIDAMPNDDLPRIFHAGLVIEDKDSGEALRHWPVRMIRHTDNAADGDAAAPDGDEGKGGTSDA